MSDANNRRIVFDFDNDNRPIGENAVDGTLFEPQYKQALHQIDIYLSELALERTEQEVRDRSIQKADTEYIPDDIDYNNNIFSFIGGRGTGKTSCMLSVANILQGKKGIDKTNYPHIEKAKFTTIDLIDPAYFDKSHNLLSLFLAKLYKSYTQRVEKDSRSELSRSDKQEFLRCYREAHAQLHRLYNEKDKGAFSDEDLMEYVEDVSASVNLKRTIQDLVDAYLACFHWKDTILILRVDDVDMDIVHASEMIESMRKYFVQPNILVFVSCDLEQLEFIKREDYIKSFPSKDMTTWCHELADRYLAKVFPHSHRIQMPDPATYHNHKLRVKGSFKTEAGVAVPEADQTDKKTYRDFVSVKQAIPELILKKTRYLFYNTNYYESYIVPRNLRELRQLMKLLITMSDYDKVKDEPRHNKTLFKEYFYDTWVQSNLNADDQKLIPRILSVRDLSLFNKTLLGIIEERFIKDNKNKQAEEVLNRIKSQVYPDATSDVLSVIALLEPKLIQEHDRKLIFFIKSYYSILLYDTYREMIKSLDEKGNRPNELKVEGDDGETKSQIIRKDPLCEFYDFEKLVSGSFIKLHTPLQDAVVIASKLSALVDEAKVLCEKETLNDEEKSRIQLAELLVLSIYRVQLIKPETRGFNLFEQFKKLSSSEEQDNILISVGALLFNITRYEQSICRYDDKFYEALCKSSSYKNIRKQIFEEAKVSNDEGLLHRVTLRNFEVLQDLFVKYERRDYSSVPERYFRELEYVSAYSFPLYEHPEGEEKHYNISLTFLGSVVKGLHPSLENVQLIDELFGNTSKQTIDVQNPTGSTQDAVPVATAPVVTEGTPAAEGRE